jgi:2-dehydropantoate 2-reductase
MKTAIVGIGGVGGYFGGLLAKQYADDKDVEIVFLARGNHLQQIKKNGLKLITEKETMVVRPDLATDDPSGCGVFDCVIFCVKAYDLKNSAERLSPSIGENTRVITLLNGVDNADKLRALLNKGKILNGCVYISGLVVQPGVVQQKGALTRLFFGNGSDEEIDGKKLETFFKKANIDAQYRTDIEHIAWEKYVFISPFASATTYLQKTMHGVLDSADGKELLETLLAEVLSIAKAKQIVLPENIRDQILEKVSGFPKTTKTSMQADFEKGSRAELETFTGYIVREARKFGIPVPTHEHVYDALKKRLYG